MPLSPATNRREIHHRVIDMRAYARDDGLYDVEAHLVDRKPFAAPRFASPDPVAAGQPRHDMWVRLILDDQLVVRDVEASSDETPYSVCKEAESTLSVMIGERIASGWSVKVKERLRGSASCTHLMELLIPLATTALQGIRGMNLEAHGAAVDANGVPRKLESCYAYGRSSELVRMIWPEHFRPRSPASTDT